MILKGLRLTLCYQLIKKKDKTILISGIFILKFI